MESVDNTAWDVVISGTGIQQSLLALASSRSDKKILHVDKNQYYGGPDAAFSLQEAESWVKTINDSPSAGNFKDASVSKEDEGPDGSQSQKPALSFSRAYSLSLSSQIIYTRSDLLASLVSSKVYRQLEFQAFGSWWLFERSPPPDDHNQGRLKRVPSGREDIFADSTIDLRSKRLLMKFLRFVGDFEHQAETWEPHASAPFTEFLSSQFSLPSELHPPLLAISMSVQTPQRTTTSFALPRIARHLRSIGMFGPGFGAVVAKWGGGAEIAQVACRAGAVGGTVYMLGNDVANVTREATESEAEPLVEVQLLKGEKINAQWLVRSELECAALTEASISSTDDSQESQLLRSTSIVSSPLSGLFSTVAEGGPQPAGAVVVFPSGSSFNTLTETTSMEMPPVHIIAHSSETGECPAGQCVLYSSVAKYGLATHSVLDMAIDQLLGTVDADQRPRVLYSLRYTQSGPLTAPSVTQQAKPSTTTLDKPIEHPTHILQFPPTSLDPVFEDSTLDRVKEIWKKVTQQPEQTEDLPDNFMVFDDREGMAADLDGED